MDEKTEAVRDACCYLLQEKLAEDVVYIDLRGVSAAADFFVVCSGTVGNHVTTLKDAVVDGMRDYGVRPGHVEGQDDSRWILIDFFDVVVHIFNPEMRELVDLEKLWGDAPVITVKDTDEDDEDNEESSA